MRNHIESSSIIPCPMPTSKSFQNLTGKVYGRLLIKSFVGKIMPPYGKARYFWECLCDCGKTVILVGGYFKYAGTRSCGCLHSEVASRAASTHRQSKCSEYRIWSGIVQRCTNIKNQAYSDYGGRGIKVCERWRVFENFIADMGPRPSPEYSIDRIDNNGDYEPSNCQWSTQLQQMGNTRNSRLLTLNGTTLCVAEWERTLGFPKGIIHNRLRYGWNNERALTENVWDNGRRRYPKTPTTPQTVQTNKTNEKTR